MQPDAMPRMMVVDDDRSLAAMIRAVGVAQGLEVRIVNQARDFRSAYGEFAPDVIALDLVMPDMDGFEVLNHLCSLRSPSRVILLSGADATYLKMAQEIGSLNGVKVAGVLAKPFRVADLRRLLSDAVAAPPP